MEIHTRETFRSRDDVIPATLTIHLDFTEEGGGRTSFPIDAHSPELTARAAAAIVESQLLIHLRSICRTFLATNKDTP